MDRRRLWVFSFIILVILTFGNFHDLGSFHDFDNYHDFLTSINTKHSHFRHLYFL